MRELRIENRQDWLCYNFIYIIYCFLSLLWIKMSRYTTMWDNGRWDLIPWYEDCVQKISSEFVINCWLSKELADTLATDFVDWTDWSKLDDVVSKKFIDNIKEEIKGNDIITDEEIRQISKKYL